MVVTDGINEHRSEPTLRRAEITSCFRLMQVLAHLFKMVATRLKQSRRAAKVEVNDLSIPETNVEALPAANKCFTLHPPGAIVAKNALA
jgi:hypothetical protein